MGAVKIRKATYTVHDAIENVGFGRFQIMLSALAGLAMMADSMEIMLLAILSPSLACEWGITAFEQALSTTCVFVGWMFSSPCWGWICDRYGRKKGLFACSLLGTLLGIATAASPSFYLFVVIRTGVGVALGGGNQAVTIYAEFLPTSARARCILFIQIFWAVGAAAEALLAIAVMPLWGWRGFVVASSLPLGIFTLACLWLPESARFYVTHGKRDKAVAVLERVAKTNGKRLPQGELIVDRAGEEGEKGRRRNALALLEKPLRSTTILVFIIWMVNAFSYYGMTLYTTKLVQSEDECYGGTPSNGTHNGAVKELCKPLTQHDYIEILTMSLSELPGLFLTFGIIDALGRKKTMGLQFLVFALCNYAFFFCMSRSTIIGLLFVARAFISGSFQTSYVYTPEVYPTHIRAVALGTASGFARASAMITPMVAQVVADYNVAYAALIYGTAGAIGTIAAFLLPIETKGREIVDFAH